MPKIFKLAFLVLPSAVFLLFSFKGFGKADFKNQDACEKLEYRAVRGNSLSGLIEPGEEVKILSNFYDCNKIQRGDIIMYRYAGNADPILKIVKAIPGDEIEIASENGGARLLINGKVAKTSRGEPYQLNDRAVKILSLYISDYKSALPKDAYLLLGNLPQGSLDSTVFGFAGRADILGKAEMRKAR